MPGGAAGRNVVGAQLPLVLLLPLPPLRWSMVRFSHTPKFLPAGRSILRLSRGAASWRGIVANVLIQPGATPTTIHWSAISTTRIRSRLLKFTPLTTFTVVPLGLRATPSRRSNHAMPAIRPTTNSSTIEICVRPLADATAAPAALPGLAAEGAGVGVGVGAGAGIVGAAGVSDMAGVAGAMTAADAGVAKGAVVIGGVIGAAVAILMETAPAMSEATSSRVWQACKIVIY